MLDLSIVISARGRRPYLMTVLKCLECQTISKERYEILVVEQDSSVYLKSIINSLGHKYVYFYNDGIFNQGKAQNLGWDNANATNIVFLDGDILVGKDFAENIIELFQQKEAFLLFERIFFLDKFHTEKILILPNPTDIRAYLRNLCDSNQLENIDRHMCRVERRRESRMGLGEIAVKKEYIKEIGGFDETLKGRSAGHDRDFIVRLNWIANIGIMNSLAIHLCHPRNDPKWFLKENKMHDFVPKE